MWRYVIKRIFTTVVVIVVAAILIFTIMNVVPGDPAASLAGTDATYEEIEAKREMLGLSGPFLVRLGRYLYNFFIKWDFGSSWFYETPIVNEIIVRIPRTIAISFSHLLLSVCVGIPVGILAAMHRGKWQDRGMLSLAMLLQSIPSFWLAMELIVVFSVNLGWFPASGIGSWRNYVLPIASGVLGGWCGTARQTRQSMLEVMRDDYITTARAKGVEENKVITHHMLPNALMPVITNIGGQVGTLVTGSLFIERTFSIPGVGIYMLNGINNRDYPVVETVTIFMAAVNALAMLLTDLTYGFVDPRIKAQYVSSTNKGRRPKKKMLKNDKQEQMGTKAKRKKQSQFVMIFKRILRDRGATLGIVILLLFVLVAIFAPLLAPYDPYELDETAMLASPSFQHWMGTDELGRDVFSRIIYGARYSLTLGVAGSVLGLMIGVVLGSLAGYLGGIVETVIMRFCDIMLSIPGTLTTIIVSAVLGTGYWVTVVALSVGGIFGRTRMLRGQILREKGKEYLEAAKAYNCGSLRVMFVHLLPNVISPLIVGFTMGIGGTINAAAGLSYIGLGVQPPLPEWGAMLSAGRNYLRKAPTLILFPGIAICIFCWCVNLFGDGLRDAMDPKLKN